MGFGEPDTASRSPQNPSWLPSQTAKTAPAEARAEMPLMRLLVLNVSKSFLRNLDMLGSGGIRL